MFKSVFFWAADSKGGILVVLTPARGKHKQPLTRLGDIVQNRIKAKHRPGGYGKMVLHNTDARFEMSIEELNQCIQEASIAVEPVLV